MKELDFERPRDLAGVINLLESRPGKCLVVAGGTDLMINLRGDDLNSKVDTLVDISLIGELSGIREDASFIYIGAGTTHAEIAENPVIMKYFPVLAEASGSVGSPQTRNRGTLGGNIVTGAQCADTIPPLLVFDAELSFEGTGGSRKMSLSEYTASAGSRRKGFSEEILKEIIVRKPDPEGRGYFHKLTRRKAVAKARINFCAWALQDGEKRITDIRIAPGAVTPLHMRFREAEELLTGKVPGRKLVADAAERIAEYMSEESGRRWSAAFKIPVLKVMAERGLLSILEVADERQ